MSPALQYTVHICILMENQLPLIAFKYQGYAFYTERVWVPKAFSSPGSLPTWATVKGYGHHGHYHLTCL